MRVCVRARACVWARVREVEGGRELACVCVRVRVCMCVCGRRASKLVAFFGFGVDSFRPTEALHPTPLRVLTESSPSTTRGLARRPSGYSPSPHRVLLEGCRCAKLTKGPMGSLQGVAARRGTHGVLKSTRGVLTGTQTRGTEGTEGTHGVLRQGARTGY